jgi:hypothetical protein
MSDIVERLRRTSFPMTVGPEEVAVEIERLRTQVAAADAIAKAINDSDSCEGFITDEIYEALEAYDALREPK